jgi:hypothetical protein
MARRNRKLPTVDILGRKYQVNRGHLDGISGQCDTGEARIDIQVGQEEYAEKDTVLHEVMHGILFQQGRSMGDGEGPEYTMEESYVRPLATGLIAFFRANPAVANWLISNPDVLR